MKSFQFSNLMDPNFNNDGRHLQYGDAMRFNFNLILHNVSSTQPMSGTFTFTDLITLNGIWQSRLLMSAQANPLLYTNAATAFMYPGGLSILEKLARFSMRVLTFYPQQKFHLSHPQGLCKYIAI
jgi:hypothetical protein